MLKEEEIILGNGAGSVKSPAEARRACKGPMTRVTVGSITKEPRAGNLGSVYYFHSHDFWSLNSLGLPNIGIEAYGPLWRDLIALAHDSGKELWASIAPLSPKECGEMTERLLCAGLDGVEINGSCPNVWDGGKRKAIPALDPATTAEMLRITKMYVGGFSQVSFKLSPTRDIGLLERIAEVLRGYGVEQLVCCNTDQARPRVDGRQALAFRANDQDREVTHKGGLAGSAAIEESVFVAATMARLVPWAKIIGCGGIFTGANASLYLEAGCIGIQSTTGYLEFKEQVFVDILMQLELAA